MFAAWFDRPFHDYDAGGPRSPCRRNPMRRRAHGVGRYVGRTRSLAVAGALAQQCDPRSRVPADGVDGDSDRRSTRRCVSAKGRRKRCSLGRSVFSARRAHSWWSVGISRRAKGYQRVIAACYRSSPAHLYRAPGFVVVGGPGCRTPPNQGGSSEAHVQTATRVKGASAPSSAP
jgi:hypothetical protein